MTHQEGFGCIMVLLQRLLLKACLILFSEDVIIFINTLSTLFHHHPSPHNMSRKCFCAAVGISN